MRAQLVLLLSSLLPVEARLSYLSLRHDAYRAPGEPAAAPLRLILTVYVHVCTRMYTYVHECTRMCTYVHVCTRMYTYVHVCIWIPADAQHASQASKPPQRQRRVHGRAPCEAPLCPLCSRSSVPFLPHPSLQACATWVAWSRRCSCA